LARPDFRAYAAQRLSEERELSPSVVNLLSPESGKTMGVRNIPVGRIEANPENPRVLFEESALDELAASIKEHGVLQPVLVRPRGQNQFQLVAGERRWRAAKLAGLESIPALVEELDDEAALEIAVIENLQREDLSPLEEADIYDRMVREHGYSIRKLAQKLGKDKGYLENRLRLADAPEEIRELVSVRKDTLSHAYELMKVADPKKRRRLAQQVASGQLSLVKLRERIEGRPQRTPGQGADPSDRSWAEPIDVDEPPDEPVPVFEPGPQAAVPQGDDALIVAKAQLQEALGGLLGVLRSGEFRASASSTDRDNLAKYLTISKLTLENAITIVRERPRE
jgi:ParB/RepB/Spo0J family partition protein